MHGAGDGRLPRNHLTQDAWYAVRRWPGFSWSAGISARHYHAGLVPEQREAIQDDFFSDNTVVIVATKAFGMGVNKPDIGWVVHYDLPESLEGLRPGGGASSAYSWPPWGCERALLHRER